MTREAPLSKRRYRRRIIGWGALALVVVFAFGAAIVLPVVQNELTDRVEDELDGAGIDGVTASFSGQDGTLRCSSPLDDPESVADLAEDTDGVRAVELDRSCTGDDGTTPLAVESATTEPSSDDDATTAPGSTAGVSSTPTSTRPAPDDVVTIIEGDPLFGQLAELLDVAGLTGDDALGGDGPFTVLAPTDDAFDAAFDRLGADAFNRLTSEPERLRQVLLHHVIDGRIDSADLVAGPITMLDGTTVDVDPDGPSFTSDGTVAGIDDPATQLDIVASNGVVHAIDEVLLPADLDLSDPAVATTSAVFDGGRLVLSGTVETEEQRERLAAAARTRVDPANVVDELSVDDIATVAPVDLDRLTGVVAAMPVNLVTGEATLEADTLSLSGVYRDDAANAALTNVGALLGVDLDLSARQRADPASAAELQNELNAFVAANPVRFQQNSTELTPESNAVIEQIAARALRLDGTTVTIVGHTDADGNPAANLTLSDGRAAVVRQALVARGLPADDVSSEGRGAQSPILGADGEEDKAASRRVEFVVTSP